MANYCTNETHIKFRNKDDRDIVFEFFNSCMSEHAFCEISTALRKADIYPYQFACRGYITDIDADDDASSFFLSYETAWEPLFKWLTSLLNRFVEPGSYEIVYHSEEPVEGHYFTNDKVIEGKEWYADIEEFR